VSPKLEATVRVLALSWLTRWVPVLVRILFG
jgi:hypothetical protein